MATNKRMFSNDIVGSDAFLEMPSTTQALYFHLGMRCDDDGFVNPNVTMRMTGANKNDLDLLIVKKFLLQFKNGVMVIKHHRINNNWDSRDCKRTLYTEELRLLFIKDNNSYTFDNQQGVEVEQKYLANKGNTSKKLLPDGTPTELRRQNRIEENRIEENNTKERNFNLPEWIKEETWGEWIKYRKERKLQKYTETGLKKLFTQLGNETNNDNNKLQEGIDFSIAKGYQGIYYPKGNIKVSNFPKSEENIDIVKAFKDKVEKNK